MSYFNRCFYLILSSLMATESFAQYKIPDPPAESLFGSDSKIVSAITFGQYLTYGVAGLIAIFCLIAAGVAFQRGNFMGALGGLVGAIVIAIGGYVIAEAQT